MRRLHFAVWLTLLGIVVFFGSASGSRAVDIEAFEFNDPDGSLLAGAVNAVNPANLWVEDPGMAPSDIRGGSYNIIKGTLVLESSFLQIGNIASGTRYLVMRSPKWDFENFDSTRLEEFRLAFLNDDTGTSGSTITAQMSIRRNSAGNVEIAGDALGPGSTNLPAPAPVATVQTALFTAVLEINKTSNSYKVYYKDGTKPTQVVGLGSIAPTRGGNSIRLAVNNDFSAFNSNYPIDPPFEVFAVDRIALADINPLTDLISLEIDRASGIITLHNTSGAALTGLESYSMTSATGAFDPSKWKTVAGNYDNGAPGSVDNAPWTVTTSSKTQLAEMFTTGDGGGLTINQPVVLSLPAGNTWIKSPFEDVHMTLNFSGGVTRTVNVNFVGNSGFKWSVGDFNFDNLLTGADWLEFIANSETNLAGLSRVEAYRKGDLNGDGLNNIADFIAFETAYDAANGGGAFAVMVASIPEPASAILFGGGLLALAAGRRRLTRAQDGPLVQSSTQVHTHELMRVHLMFRTHVLVCAALAAALLVAARPAHAVILQDFPFSDVNSTPLEAAENVAQPGTNWFLGSGTSTLDPSTVLNGNYRITKTSTGLATAFIDITNVSTGTVWLVAEFSGWNYTSTPSGTSEEVRFAFLDNDPPAPNSSTIAAQMDIRRSATALQLVGMGALGTGATNIAGNFPLPLVRSTPFTAVLELDKTLDKYSVYYKDNTAPFALLGTAELGASTLNPGDRDGNSIRFGATGQFNDTDEFVDINRIYLTDTSPVGPVTPVALTLEARSDGLITLKNNTPNPITFNSYRAASPTDALNFAGWNSLSTQGVSAVDGPDPGLTPGDGIGETWDQAGGSNDSVLAESFLLGTSTLAPNDGLPIGFAFDVGGAHNLTFQYRDVTNGAIVTGDVTYPIAAGVPGDYNNNGLVDAADYVLWRNGGPLLNEVDAPGTVNGADYTAWRARFGNSGVGVSLSGPTVPEPSSWILLAVAAGGLVAGRRRRRDCGR
jgi:hypothetical protein